MQDREEKKSEDRNIDRELKWFGFIIYLWLCFFFEFKIAKDQLTQSKG